MSSRLKLLDESALKECKLVKNRWYDFRLIGPDFLDGQVLVRLLHASDLKAVRDNTNDSRPIIFKSRIFESDEGDIEQNECIVSLRLFILTSQYRGRFIIEFEFLSNDKKICERVRTHEIEVSAKADRVADKVEYVRPNKKFRNDDVHGMMSKILTEIESLKVLAPTSLLSNEHLPIFAEEKNKGALVLQMLVNQYNQNGSDWLRDQMKHLDSGALVSLTEIGFILNPPYNGFEDFESYF